MSTIDVNNASHDDLGLVESKGQTGPEVRLEPRDEGSFLYPPETCANLEAYTNFWLNVPIPESILGNVCAGYDDLIRGLRDAERLRWMAAYDRENGASLHHKDPSIALAAAEERELADYMHIDNWHRENHPSQLPPTAIRSVVRAGQMAWYRYLLPEEDQERVLDMTFLVRQTDMPISKMVHRYLLSDLRDSFRDPEITASERLEDIRLELRRLQSGGV